MAKSSIHLQTAKGGTILHNARENYSKSVVFTDEKNEIWNDSKTAFKLFRDELEIRSNAYTQRTKQKLQKHTSTMISGVVNLEQKHTLKDMEKIKDYLEKEFDTKVIQMSVHRDEGKLINKENEDLKLVSGKDFFLNAKDNELYFDNKFTKKINMDEWKIEKNYHGHFEMLGFDTQGKTLRKKMNIVKLSKLQDFTAQSLGMERTLSNVIVNEKGKAQRKSTTNKKRLDTHEFKEQAKIINETKKDLVSEKELKKQIQELKKELQDEKAKRPDYAKLEDMNKTLLQRVINKNLTINDFQIEITKYKKNREDLKKQIDTLTVENKDLKNLTSTLAAESVENFKEAEKYKEKVKALETQNKSLQEQINTKPIQTIQNNQIEVLNYSKAESELSQDFYSRIEKREFKTGLMSKEDFTIIKKQEVGTPTILEVIKSHFKKMYNSLHEKIKSLTVENINLKKANLDLKIENLKLTNEINKNKSLSLTGETEKKENLFEKVKRINENEKLFKEQMKKEKDQEQPKAKEEIKPKQQYRGYQLG